jgi:hypothetical protein
MIEIRLNGFLLLEGTAKKHGNSAYVGVPRAWVGKRVATVLLEPLPDENETRVIDVRPLNGKPKIKREE